MNSRTGQTKQADVMSNCIVLITKVITRYKNYRGKYKLSSNPILAKKKENNNNKINKISSFP